MAIGMVTIAWRKRQLKRDAKGESDVGGLAKDGACHDAIANKRNTVLLLIAEVFGGVSPFTHSVLVRLCKEARTGQDGTRYSLMCPQSYYQHWATALSTAIVCGDAEALLDGKRRKEAHHVATPAVQAQ